MLASVNGSPLTSAPAHLPTPVASTDSVANNFVAGRNLPGRPTEALSGRGDNTTPVAERLVSRVRAKQPATAPAARGCAATVGRKTCLVRHRGGRASERVADAGRSDRKAVGTVEISLRKELPESAS